MKTIRISPLQKPISAEIEIPGSKSYTNRAFLLASLTHGLVKIINPLFSDDTKAMIACLRTLGVKILNKKNSLEVVGSIDDIKNKEFVLNANLSGTTLRFILPLLTVVPGIKTLGGKDSLNNRPIKILVDALRTFGAKIEYVDKEGFPPVRVTSSTLKSAEIILDGNVSSQYFSALLMVLPLIGDVTITTKGVQISKPYIDMTLEAMEKFGVTVRNENHKKYVISKQQNYKAKEFLVEGDFSSAGYFFAIAALTKSTITVTNLNPHSLQADKKILDVLEKMGNKIVLGENEITIIGKSIKPIVVDVTDFPDSAQTLAVLAAFAKGTTKITGIQSLRIKETNRILALQQELKKMGIQTSSTKNVLTIHGGNPKSAAIGTYNDHRMAMAFAIAGTKLQGMKINNPDVVTKTFPTFWDQLKKLGIKIEKRNRSKQKIVLIGFMGSGKSSLAPLLAKRLGFKSIEMDEVVLKSSREKSIKEIFEKSGESHFRSLEQQVAESLKNEEKIVISAGGGVVMNQQTINALSKDSIVIFLSTKLETLRKRLKGTKDRPLWNNIAIAKSLFTLRQPLYENAAGIVISTDDKSVTDISSEIIQKLEVLLV